MSNESEVLVERRGSACWITINRESRRNAMNAGVLAAIGAGMLEAARDRSVRAIVLTGAGDKAFCAGADLSGGTSVFARGLDDPTTDFGRLARIVRDIGVPVIARINGACVAGGMGLMALCDLAVVADHARFGLPEVKVGVFPMQVLVYLRSLLNVRQINELCLTGELIDAARARELGIANIVVPAVELDAAVAKLCEKLAAASPAAIRRGKFAAAAMQSMSFHEAIAFAEAQITLTSMSPDATEGLAAFNERRPPRWPSSSGEGGGES
jgi:enoyl-CoA hydratase/carnithine racemase